MLLINHVAPERAAATQTSMTVRFHGFFEKFPHIPEMKINPAAKKGSAGRKKFIRSPKNPIDRVSKQV